MGKTPRSAQNGEVPEETQHATRLRPEEIVARSFQNPFTPDSNGGDGWSPRARRLFLVGLAVAGAVLVTIGILFTGEIGPGLGTPSPVETGPTNGLRGTVPFGVEQPPVTPAASPTTAKPSNPTTPTASPALPALPESQSQTPSADPAQPAPASAAAAPTTETTKPAPKTPTTTTPCSLLGSKELGAQIPPLCR